MNGKKAKKLRRLSKQMAIGKPVSEQEVIYKKNKSVYKDIKQGK